MKEFKITEGRKCTDCKYYIYKEDTEWHDMCSYGDKGLFECVVEEAESCHGYKENLSLRKEASEEGE